MSRFGQQVGFALRTSWPMALWGLAGGLFLGLIAPVEMAWLPAAVAGACAVMGLACLDLGGRREPPLDLARPVHRAIVLERSTTGEQFGHAFAASAVALIALSAGLWVVDLAGL